VFAFCSERSPPPSCSLSAGRATRTPADTTNHHAPLPEDESAVRPQREGAPWSSPGRTTPRLGPTAGSATRWALRAAAPRRLLARSGWFPCGTSTASQAGTSTGRWTALCGERLVSLRNQHGYQGHQRHRRPTRCRAPRDQQRARRAREAPGQVQRVRALAHLGTGRLGRGPGVAQQQTTQSAPGCVFLASSQQPARRYGHHPPQHLLGERAAHRRPPTALTLLPVRRQLGPRPTTRGQPPAGHALGKRAQERQPPP